jgi:hypothetical protein
MFIVRAMMACRGLEVREQWADGAVALIQVACSIHQGYTSRFPGYISQANMLPVSESGATRKTQDNSLKNFILDL